LPPDLVLQISSVLEALTRARHALGAADPSGQLWAACPLFRRQAGRAADVRGGRPCDRHS
jgi:hypothetical protein